MLIVSSCSISVLHWISHHYRDVIQIQITVNFLAERNGKGEEETQALTNLQPASHPLERESMCFLGNGQHGFTIYELSKFLFLFIK